jgi:putative phosphoribosyl transferase
MTQAMTVDAVRVPVAQAVVNGDLHVPRSAAGLIVFAHGSGSSRFSPRNRAVAAVLEQAGYGTLLLDLLTGSEEAEDARTGEHRFNIPFLAERLVGVVDWTQARADLRTLPLAFFGASTGAAAALMAAAQRPDVVRAVVSRGGRPDLADDALARVTAPTLLIVGGDDVPVIAMNRDAMRQMQAPVALEIIPGAAHLFEEPGALDRVARLAVDWCHRHLSKQTER